MDPSALRAEGLVTPACQLVAVGKRGGRGESGAPLQVWPLDATSIPLVCRHTRTSSRFDRATLTLLARPTQGSFVVGRVFASLAIIGSVRVRASQAAINAQLVAAAATGARVVRLKGGDPFVFGRPRGECEALAAAGHAFRVLPGVSSCLAAPLLAGVPLTDPSCGAASFAVFSGADTKGQLATGGWAKASGAADTLVFLMAVR